LNKVSFGPRQFLCGALQKYFEEGFTPPEFKMSGDTPIGEKENLNPGGRRFSSPKKIPRG